MYFLREVNQLPFLALKSSPTALQGAKSNRQGSLKIMVNCNSPGQEETYHSRFPVAQAICLTLHQVALEYVFIEW